MTLRQPVSGWEFLNAGDNEAACREFERYIAENPGDSSAYIGLGKALGRLERNSEALNSFKIALHLAPENSEAHYGIGATYSHLGLPTEALESFEQAIQFDPANSDAHYGAAWSYTEMGDRESAIFHARQAADLAPDVARNHLLVAECIGNKEAETTLWHLEMANRLEGKHLGWRRRCLLLVYRVFAGSVYSVHQFLMGWALIAGVYATSLSLPDLQRWLLVATLPFVGVSGYSFVKHRYYRATWALGLGLLWAVSMYLLLVMGKGG